MENPFCHPKARAIEPEPSAPKTRRHRLLRFPHGPRRIGFAKRPTSKERLASHRPLMEPIIITQQRNACEAVAPPHWPTTAQLHRAVTKVLSKINTMIAQCCTGLRSLTVWRFRRRLIAWTINQAKIASLDANDGMCETHRSHRRWRIRFTPEDDSDDSQHSAEVPTEDAKKAAPRKFLNYLMKASRRRR